MHWLIKILTTCPALRWWQTWSIRKKTLRLSFCWILPCQASTNCWAKLKTGWASANRRSIINIIPLLNKPFNSYPFALRIKSLSQPSPLLLSKPLPVPRMSHVSVPLLPQKFLPEPHSMFLLASKACWHPLEPLLWARARPCGGCYWCQGVLCLESQSCNCFPTWRAKWQPFTRARHRW